jgi:kinesin family protein 15
LEFLFEQIVRNTRRSNGAVQYSCRCSFFEIFNERVFDLLDVVAGNEGGGGGSGGNSEPSSRSSRNSSSSMMLNLEDLAGLQVREDQRRGVYVDGLQELPVASAAEASVQLGRGYRNRRVAETAMNRESSRSHAVFQLLVESLDRGDPSGVRRSKVSRFNLVDLAGSERQKSTASSGDRLKEANAINKSLSALGLVINALVDKCNGKMRHVPYRDSKLTFLLRDSLGGNSRTFLIATVSPSDEQFGESLSTLKFSQRAKEITNTAVVNEDTLGSQETMQKEISRLKSELFLLKAHHAAGASSGGGGSSAMATPSPAAPVVATADSMAALDADGLLSASLERFTVVKRQADRFSPLRLAAAFFGEPPAPLAHFCTSIEAALCFVPCML